MKILGLISQSGAGLALARLFQKSGLVVLAYEYDSAWRQQLANEGFVTASSVQGVLMHLPALKVIWVMLPEGEKKEALMKQLSGLLEAGSVVVDGVLKNDESAGRWLEFFSQRGISYLFFNKKSNAICGAARGMEICQPLFEIPGTSIIQFLLD